MRVILSRLGSPVVNSRASNVINNSSTVGRQDRVAQRRYITVPVLSFLLDPAECSLLST
jgi:hypothetical protein